MLARKKTTKQEYMKMSLAELEYFLILQGRARISVSDKVRQLNRTWNKNLTVFGCQVCGYNKHVELAHLKAISEFKQTCLLEEVNNPDNILVLCPNHHKEYDIGCLELVDIPTRK